MTAIFNDNETILGRGEINDIDAILAIPTHDPNEIEHIVKNNADTIFTWDYSLARPALRKLYEKAKTGQWNGTTDLPWDTDVDVEKVVAADQEILGTGLDANLYIGTRGREVGRQGVARVRHRGPQLDAQPVPPRRAGRARSAPPRSSRPCRGTTPSCTPPRR